MPENEIEIGLSGKKIRFMSIILCAVGQLFYLLNHYKITGSLNEIKIIAIFLSINLSSIFFYYMKWYRLSSFLTIASTQASITYQIFLAGGIRAPAPYWFALMPVFWGVFFEKIGSIVGFVTVIITYGIFYKYIDQITPAPYLNIESTFSYISFENLMAFTSFTFFFILGYLIMLNRAKVEIVEKNEQVKTLLRILIHDVSNPLMALNIKIKKMLKDKNRNEELIHKTIDSLVSVNEIVQNVRSMIAIEDGKIILSKTDVKVVDLVSECSKDIDHLIKKKDIEIKLIGDLDSCINIDKIMFKNQVLLNLLTNAIKFSHPTGTIIIDIKKSELTTSLFIVDNGTGIPDELMGDLFSGHKVTTRTGTSGEKGTGYGMPIVKKIIEEHQGTLKVQSPPPSKYFNEGTIVEISLPNTQCSEEKKVA